jgi:AcrR family transcriptional regulator
MSILNDQQCLPTNEEAAGDEVVLDSSSARVPARKLRLKARAERMGETRRRIARATYELHASVGPARTTVSAIAERAGVQRLTVYKHFPRERDIFQACTTYHWELDPPPDPVRWRDIADAEQRLRQALAELYAYFRRNETILANVARDIALVLEQMDGLPPPAMQAFAALPSQWLTALASGWPDDAEQPPLRTAALALAIDFGVWRTLARGQDLDDPQAIELMVALVTCAAAPR